MISQERIVAFTEVLRQSQFWPPEKMRTYQQEQVSRLLRHAYETVPFYRDRLAPLFRRRWGPRLHKWHEVPILTRSQLKRQMHAINSEAIPAGHGEPFEVSTSGSTGIPLTILSTPLAATATHASTVRDFDWHNVDANRSFALIVGHIGTYPEGVSSVGWSDVHLALGFGGTGHRLDIDTPNTSQLEWLARIRPDYLASHASNLAELARLTVLHAKSEIAPKVTFAGGECITQQNRQHCISAWGAPPIERYGAQEVGNIATQCPQCGQLHVQDEIILVEIVDADGMPAKPGETGRVVVTPFYNYASPLVRYEIGDWAKVGDPSSCATRSTAIAQVLGRMRDMFIFRDGKRIWPGLSAINTQAIFPFHQYQLVQETLDDVTFKFTAQKEPTPDEARQLTTLIKKLLQHDIQVTLKRVGEFNRHPSGKFVSRISKVSARDSHDLLGSAQ